LNPVRNCCVDVKYGENGKRSPTSPVKLRVSAVFVPARLHGRSIAGKAVLMRVMRVTDPMTADPVVVDFDSNPPRRRLPDAFELQTLR
jgi:hypothetical protein